MNKYYKIIGYIMELILFTGLIIISYNYNLTMYYILLTVIYIISIYNMFIKIDENKTAQIVYTILSILSIILIMDTFSLLSFIIGIFTLVLFIIQYIILEIKCRRLHKEIVNRLSNLLNDMKNFNDKYRD